MNVASATTSHPQRVTAGSGTMPDRIVIRGGSALGGSLRIGGAKNAALPMMAAALLTDEPCILENVPVLAIDLRADEQNSQAALGKTATLQANPRDAQKLVLATQVGRLSLALRNIESLDPSGRGTVTTRDLGGGYYIGARPAASSAAAPRAPALASAAGAQAAATALPRRPSGPTMTVVRGTASTLEEVQRHGR